MWIAVILCSSTYVSPCKLCVLHKNTMKVFARLFILANYIVKQLSIYPFVMAKPNFLHPIKNEQ